MSHFNESYKFMRFVLHSYIIAAAKQEIGEGASCLNTNNKEEVTRNLLEVSQKIVKFCFKNLRHGIQQEM